MRANFRQTSFTSGEKMTRHIFTEVDLFAQAFQPSSGFR
jgi:hypothetical protein